MTLYINVVIGSNGTQRADSIDNNNINNFTSLEKTIEINSNVLNNYGITTTIVTDKVTQLDREYNVNFLMGESISMEKILLMIKMIQCLSVYCTSYKELFELMKNPIKYFDHNIILAGCTQEIVCYNEYGRLNIDAVCANSCLNVDILRDILPLFNHEILKFIESSEHISMEVPKWAIEIFREDSLCINKEDRLLSTDIISIMYDIVTIIGKFAEIESYETKKENVSIIKTMFEMAQSETLSRRNEKMSCHTTTHMRLKIDSDTEMMFIGPKFVKDMIDNVRIIFVQSDILEHYENINKVIETIYYNHKLLKHCLLFAIEL